VERHREVRCDRDGIFVIDLQEADGNNLGVIEDVFWEWTGLNVHGDQLVAGFNLYGVVYFGAAEIPR
jgi:hypothetical protein